MADSTKKYVTALGFVQFEPQEREANGKEVTDITLKTPGGDGKLIRVTIWPEQEVEASLGRKIEQGDFVATEGAFSSSTYQDREGKTKTSLQISAYRLHVNGTPVKRADREVVTATRDDDSF